MVSSEISRRSEKDLRNSMNIAELGKPTLRNQVALNFLRKGFAVAHRVDLTVRESPEWFATTEDCFLAGF